MTATIIALKPTTDQLSQYINDISDVTSYSYSLTQTGLPALTILVPDWYAEFAEKLAVAKSHCLDWTNGILTSLTTIPQSLVNLNTLLQAELNVITKSLQALQADPQNESAIQAIQACIPKLQAAIESVQLTINGLDDAMAEFNTELVSDSAVLSAIASDAMASAEADTAQIQKLVDSVNTLQDTINSKKQLVKLEKGLKIDYIIFISTVKIVVGVLIEDEDMVVDAAVSALEDTYNVIVADGADVKAEQDEIANVQAEMDQENKAIAMLKSISLTFDQLLQENEEVQKSATGVRNFWQAAVYETYQMVQDLDKMLNDLSASDIDSAINDVTDLSEQWNEIEEQAFLIKDIKYKFDKNVASIS
ncbi:hypothetical protein [Paenibacillus sp. YYML68]|uniref:hypothetical protein n=1 Tax=Paenibacillus sp. YYML68 TaxID=2909250 RepID=UPI0024933A86|nr:hypothetical protein [Paenibacillus sp. YYML68]